MGALTGLAIGLHNVPEGLATFVATLASPAFGGALALAIALHNIPEGVCVAMPVYYATGSRVRGFLWAFLSGISEPLGVCVCVSACVRACVCVHACVCMYISVRYTLGRYTWTVICCCGETFVVGSTLGILQITIYSLHKSSCHFLHFA